MASDTPPPIRKKVSDIKSSLLRPALTSHFQCWFNPPQDVRKWLEKRESAGVGINYNGNQEFFSLSCSEASLPGSSLNTIELNNDHTGVTERHAYRRVYDDRADFTFYVDHGHNVIKFFENWIAYIVGEEFAEGIERPEYFYRVNYPDGDGKNKSSGYRSPAIYINKFERDYIGRYTQYKFLKAYPIAITSMPVSYESASLLKCTVSFTYTRYIIAGEYNIESNSFDQLTPQKLAAINGAAFNPNADLGLDYGKYTTTGGVTYPAAAASGNTVATAFNSSSLI